MLTKETWNDFNQDRSISLININKTNKVALITNIFLYFSFNRIFSCFNWKLSLTESFQLIQEKIFFAT